MRISPNDEAALDWYFGQGQALFGRSTTGAMLDRAELYVVEAPWDIEMRAAIQHRRPNEPPPDALTAAPTGSTSSDEGSYVPNEGALRRFAAISKRLSFMDAIDSNTPSAVMTLSRYYGDDGARWGADEQGRIHAVLPLTVAGWALVKRARARMEQLGQTDQGLRPAEVLRNEIILQRHRYDKRRRKLLDRARAESWALYRAAVRLWVQSANTRKDHHHSTDRGSAQHSR